MKAGFPSPFPSMAAVLLSWGTILLGAPSWGAEESPGSEDSLQAKGNTFIPFPFYMYSPETKSAGGVVTTFLRRPDGARRDWKPSSYTATFVFTQKKQVVVAAELERYWQAERYQLQGGAAFSRFPDTFFGLGNDTNKDISEDHTPRTVAFAVSLRREIAPDVRLGPRAAYAHAEMREVEEGGILDRGEVRGSDGGSVVQLGASVGRDRRDNIVYPRTGSLLELAVDVSDARLGSDFGFTTWNADLRWYRSLSRHQVVAVRGIATLTTGAPPFQMLAGLGGDDIMRGFYEGRFRDRDRYVLQAETRIGFWWRLGVAAFADVGDVAGRLSDFRRDEARFAAGLGFRVLIDRDEGVTLRADLATGDDGSGGMYLSILEAY